MREARITAIFNICADVGLLLMLVAGFDLLENILAKRNNEMTTLQKSCWKKKKIKRYDWISFSFLSYNAFKT